MHLRFADRVQHSQRACWANTLAATWASARRHMYDNARSSHEQRPLFDAVEERGQGDQEGLNGVSGTESQRHAATTELPARDGYSCS